MVANDSLTSVEKWHIQVMSSIAKSVADTPLILKGGTALLLCYGLDRFSEDLDFDSTKKIRLESRIKNALLSPIQIKSLDILKDTETVTRYRLVYDSPDSQDNRLKIEISYRNQSVGLTQIIHNIKVYDIPTLVQQKLLAVEHRTQARDLYDIRFLVKNYTHLINASQWEKISSILLHDLDSLEKRFIPAFEDDEILSTQDISKIILDLQEIYRTREMTADPLIQNLGEDTKNTIKIYVQKQLELSELVRQKTLFLTSDPALSKEFAKQAVSHNEELKGIAKELVANSDIQKYLQQSQFASLQKQGGFKEIHERFQKKEILAQDVLAVLKYAKEQVQTISRSHTQNQNKGNGRKN